MLKRQVTDEMEWLSQQDDTVFIGEGLINANRIYGTMNYVPTSKCIEMPIDENLIVGCAMGLAIEGYRPIVIFQRMDFMLVAADAIINHLALIPQMSRYQYKLPVIIRSIVGSQDKSFDVGCQHNHDFTHVFSPYLHTVRYSSSTNVYKDVYVKYKDPVLVVEYKDSLS